MPERAYIADATPDNFRQLVLENSHKGPVVVNYWAPWAGPCLKLWPVLEKLAGEFSGKFFLVNVNTDRYKQLAKEHDVNSLPTVKVFRRGTVVDQVHGAESEAAFRKLIEKHVPTVSSPLLVSAVKRLHAGDLEGALAALDDACAQNPQDARVRLTQAKLLLQNERYEEAESALRALPASEQEQKEAATLLAHASFMQVIDDTSEETLRKRVAERADDLGARHQLAARALLSDRYEEAIVELLEILRRDRDYAGQNIRRGLSTLFNLLGRDHPLSQRYRKDMLNILH